MNQKTVVVNYKGKNIPIDKFLEQIQKMPKEELSELIGDSKITNQVAARLKSPEIRKKYNLSLL